MNLAAKETGEVAAEAFMLGRLALVPDLSGALYLPDERTLVVADLHLEKGSAYAARGVLLPPYDSAATLRLLGAAILGEVVSPSIVGGLVLVLIGVAAMTMQAGRPAQRPAS